MRQQAGRIESSPPWAGHFSYNEARAGGKGEPGVSQASPEGMRALAKHPCHPSEGELQSHLPVQGETNYRFPFIPGRACRESGRFGFDGVNFFPENSRKYKPERG